MSFSEIKTPRNSGTPPITYGAVESCTHTEYRRDESTQNNLIASYLENGLTF